MPTCTYLHVYSRNGWMDDLQFYVIFNRISVIQPIYFADPSGQGPRFCPLVIEFLLWHSFEEICWNLAEVDFINCLGALRVNNKSNKNK